MNTFRELTEQIADLHERKNEDYGNAFAKSFQQYESIRKGAGLEYAVGRMGDKMARLQNLAFSGKEPNNESIEDNLKDLAAYAIMTLEEYSKRKVNPVLQDNFAKVDKIVRDEVRQNMEEEYSPF